MEHEEAKGGSAPFVESDHEAAGGPLQPDDHEDVRSAESASLGRSAPLDGASTPASEVPGQHFKKCKTGISGSAGMELQEVPKPHPSQKGKSHIDPIHTETSPSVCRAAGRTDAARLVQNVVLGMSEQGQLAWILDNCELWIFDPETAKVFANTIERLFYSDSFRIGKAVLPLANVRSRLWDLDAVIFQSVGGRETVCGSTKGVRTGSDPPDGLIHQNRKGAKQHGNGTYGELPAPEGTGPAARDCAQAGAGQRPDVPEPVEAETPEEPPKRKRAARKKTGKAADDPDPAPGDTLEGSEDLPAPEDAPLEDGPLGEGLSEMV